MQTVSWSRNRSRDYSRKTIRQHYASLDQFLHSWQTSERKEAIIAELAAEGLFLDPLLEEIGKDLDPFDLLCHIAFDQPPLQTSETADLFLALIIRLLKNGGRTDGSV